MAVPVIDKELCISCGNCIELCPTVFGWDEDEIAHVIKEDRCQECDFQQAMEECPTNALTLQER
jgi:ferredoxin